MERLWFRDEKPLSITAKLSPHSYVAWKNEALLYRRIEWTNMKHCFNTRSAYMCSHMCLFDNNIKLPIASLNRIDLLFFQILSHFEVIKLLIKSSSIGECTSNPIIAFKKGTPSTQCRCFAIMKRRPMKISSKMFPKRCFECIDCRTCFQLMKLKGSVANYQDFWGCIFDFDPSHK